MRIKNFKDYSDLPGLITIEDFTKSLGLKKKDCDKVSSWWKENNPDIKIQYFDFKVPLLGAAISPDAVAINKNGRPDPLFKLFLLIHESRHLHDNRMSKEFQEGYFESVVNDDFPTFEKAYKKFEKAANDWTIDAMMKLGFSRFVNQENLRINESYASVVFQMMKQDIKRIGAKNIFELIRKQII
jgi:hypothetical protein